jgi:hypothetical protein
MSYVFTLNTFILLVLSANVVVTIADSRGIWTVRKNYLKLEIILNEILKCYLLVVLLRPKKPGTGQGCTLGEGGSKITKSCPSFLWYCCTPVKYFLCYRIPTNVCCRTEKSSQIVATPRRQCVECAPVMAGTYKQPILIANFHPAFFPGFALILIKLNSIHFIVHTSYRLQ